MIIRTVHNNENPYFQMNRASVNDDRLSYKAIGIHTYLMSKPDRWEANESDITNRHTDGKASVRAGVQELIRFGYMTRVQLRQEKKIIGWRLDTYETPELNPHYNPDASPEYVIVDLDSENQNVVNLDSDFQDVEKQDVGNRNHSNNRSVVNKELQGKESIVNPVAQTQHASPAQSQSTGDPLIDAAKAKQERRKANGGNYLQDWQVDLNKKVPAKERVVMADGLAELFGLSAKMKNDDRTLRTMHEQAVTLFEMGYTSFESVDSLFKLWVADEWRNKNRDKLTVYKFTDFASQKIQEQKKKAIRQRKVITIFNQYSGQYEERVIQ